MQFMRADMLSRVPDQPDHAKTCLKSYGLHSVWLVQPGSGPPRILKVWPLGLWTAMKIAMGIAQPQRQIRGLERLRRIGVRTPACIGSWRIGRRGLRPMIVLELEYAPGHSAWELICNAPDSPRVDRHSLVRAAREVGAAVVAMANGKVFHRDLKPSNVVLNLADPQQPEAWIIDTVGVRRMRRRAVEIERMLERLAIQPIRLDAAVAREIRTALLRCALRPLTRAERREVLDGLRMRVNLTGP